MKPKTRHEHEGPKTQEKKLPTTPESQKPRSAAKERPAVQTEADYRHRAIVLRTPAPRMFAFLLLLAAAPLAQAEDRVPGETERAKVAPNVIQYYRAHDSRGVNQFEPPKEEGIPYNGFALSWGGGFTQQFQALHHSNNATPVLSGTPPVNQNQLKRIGAGFNNATANMYMDAQLAQGIRVEMTTYLSSRHHNETWVKDGFLLIDGSPWENVTLDKLMRYLTLRVGHFEVNYGDAHFRSTDNGSAIANPFVGNLILNAFTTEIGAEVYLRHDGYMAMVGATGGEIRGSVANPQDRAPTYLGKAGFDKQVDENVRVRLTGSLYTTTKSANNTLYTGSRAGSRYYEVLTNTAGSVSAQAWTGDIQPGLSSKVTAMCLNPFVKVGGFEFFGTLEQAKGKTAAEIAANAPERKWTQFAGELLYRFAWDDLYVGTRYNTVKGRFAGFAEDVTVNRVQVGGGWFMTPGILLKAEYVRQEHKDYPLTNIHHDGMFEGMMIEGVVAF
jgi:hypothetical protein